MSKKKSPTGRTTRSPKKPNSTTNNQKGANTERKQEAAVRVQLREDFLAKRETLLTLKNLDQRILQQTLGTLPEGDTREFIKGVIKKLKTQKKR